MIFSFSKMYSTLSSPTTMLDKSGEESNLGAIQLNPRSTLFGAGCSFHLRFIKQMFKARCSLVGWALLWIEVSCPSSASALQLHANVLTGWMEDA